MICSYTFKTPKTPRHHEQVQQGGRIQNQFTEIIRCSIHQNEQTGKEYMETVPFTIAAKKKSTTYK
jgi:hypothetical protein